MALLLYAATFGVLFGTVSVELPGAALYEAIELELDEMPEPEPEPEPEVQEPQAHDEPAPDESRNAVRGSDAETRTVNPRALFRQSQSGPDDPENAGNPHAREGDTDKVSGTGSGLSPEGSDQLDKGLQGRGLAGALPKPRYRGNVTGKVVVRVTVDASGRVATAAYEPVGSTISDDNLIHDAIEAARKARFTESKAMVQGGTITYVFTQT